MKQYGVTRQTVLTNLYRYYLEEGSLRAGGLDQLLSLPGATRDAIRRAFDELGTERMKSVFDRMGGEVSYDDIALYRLAYLADKGKES